MRPVPRPVPFALLLVLVATTGAGCTRVHPDGTVAGDVVIGDQTPVRDFFAGSEHVQTCTLRGAERLSGGAFDVEEDLLHVIIAAPLDAPILETSRGGRTGPVWMYDGHVEWRLAADPLGDTAGPARRVRFGFDTRTGAITVDDTVLRATGGDLVVVVLDADWTQTVYQVQDDVSIVAGPEEIVSELRRCFPERVK